MRRWLRRVVLSLWIPLYLGIFHTPVVGPLIFYLGPIKSAVVLAFAVGAWSTGFYLLLCRGYELKGTQRHLALLKKKRERGLFARIRERLSRHFSGVRAWLAKQFSEKLLSSPLRIFIVFIYPGPLFGVLAVRAAYVARIGKEALLLIWVGCVVSAFLWTFLGWPVVALLRRLAGILLELV